MSYQVIARKYRPQRFADVVGQEHVTQTLANAITQNRVAHAYLFCGPRGTGKTTTARIFAMALNCTGGPRVEFPDDDPRCLEIAEGRSLDVIEIDGASNNGVEQVRELRDAVKFAPASSKFKIYIIDEVHMLSTAAFNALLKTLEEPPAHVKFFFATTDPEKVLPTILSRCQRFDLRRIPTALIVRHLTEISQKEGVTIDDAALHAIARGADGGMRDAESTLDQLISFCGNQIEESDVLSMFGLTARAQLISLAGALTEGNAEAALREFNDLAKNGKDLGRLLADLLNHFRNLLIFFVSRGDLKLLEISEAEASIIPAQTKGMDAGALTRIMEVLSECEGRLRDAASKRILIEVALLKAIQARQASSIDAVLKQLQQLRNESPVGASTPGGSSSGALPSEPALSPRRAAPTPPPLEARSVAAAEPQDRPGEFVAAPAPATVTVPATDASGELDATWRQLLEAVGRASPFTRSYLLEAHPVSFDKGLLIIGFDPEFSDHLGLVDNSKNHALIKTKLAEMGHPGAMVKFIKDDAPAIRSAPPTSSVPAPVSTAPAAPALSPTAAPRPSTPAPAARPRSDSAQLTKEDFKNDPLIKKALEIFKGQIVDVRA